LDKLDPVRNAGYRAEHHERCLSGTRESILEDIMRWAQNSQGQPVYWLNGLAGTGKSTIAQTFSEMARDCNVLGASFFCSRDYLDRKILKNIFPTLAYQLACQYPRFRDHLVKVIRRDPSVAHNSLISQLRDLLVDPLSATGISCAIVIDALDECVDEKPASAILSVLGRLVSKLPLVKFFITGRPEPRIRSGFRLPLLEPVTQVFFLHEVESTSIGGDIRLYLTEKLTAIAKRRSDLDLPGVWPLDEDIAVLVKKSSRLFIFASTAARFIESEHHDPRERLQLIVGNTDDTSHEGASGIDSLYSQVLRDAFFGIKEESVFVDLKRTLSAVVLALNPLSRDGLMQLLNIDSTVISTRLRYLHSVLLVPTDESKEIRVFHKSFPDFLQDPDRCRDSRFHIDHSTRHGDMAQSCLDLVGKLQINPCQLPPFVMNEDVPDRPQLMEKLGSGLRYACEYWSTHLSLSSSRGEYRYRLITSTSRFFDRSLFPWMEVMSLEGHLEGVIHSMNHIFEWLSRVSDLRYDQYSRHRSLTITERKASIEGGPLFDLTTDCLRFALHFFRPIQMSAQHIYHTALPLSPEASVLRLRFFDNHSSWEAHLTTWQASSSSIPTTWGPILRTIKTDSGIFTRVSVAGHRITAVCQDNTVNVYDAVTGVLRLSLNPPQQVTKVEGSPDGSIIFFAHRQACEITVWDTQTGGLIRTLETAFEINDIAVSLTGKYLGGCPSGGTFVVWEVGSGRRDSHSMDQPIVSICWLEPEDQVALALEYAVVVLEATTGKILHTCPVEEGVQRIAFSACQRMLIVLCAWGIKNAVMTIDIRTGVALPSTSAPGDISGLVFSNDGSRALCATHKGNLLSCTPGFLSGWDHHLSHLGPIHSMAILQSGHLAVGSGETIQLLEPEYVLPLKASLGREIVHVYQLNDDQAIHASSRDHRSVKLLDPWNMQILANHHVELDGLDASVAPRFLCASIDTDQHIAVLRLRRLNMFSLKLHTVDGLSLSEEEELSEEELSERPVLLGALSPSGSTLVTVREGPRLYEGGADQWELCVNKVLGGKKGRVLAFPHLPRRDLDGKLPSKIVFTSEAQFYVEGDPEDDTKYDTEDHNIPTPLTSTMPKQLEVLHANPLVHMFADDEMTISTTSSDNQFRTGVRHNLKERRVRKTFNFYLKIEEVSREEIPTTNPYTLDENLEWVMDAKSRRVCWLPPGYVSGIGDGQFFVGSSIVMAGKDGVVRRLTFRDPSSDS